ncbi:MAG TPA: NUDIX hydrolase [Ramlibacter sp.]|nr:NUDIX hydrolase [Ramlibacter sp.]
MELHDLQAGIQVRSAASVVMLRDGPCGLEVFLIKRHGLSEVLGGAHVFPGGKVDVSDMRLDMQACLDAPAALLHAALNEPQLDELSAAALYVAALREVFEETGVLYARGAGAPEAVSAGQLLREGLAFGDLLARMSLRLEASRLQPWSRWITPLIGGVSRKRFDTRFFLASVPAGQMPRHDNHEATDSMWLSPRAALQQYWDGRMQLAPPQILGLAHLARHPDVSAALAQARLRPPPLVEPEPFEHDGMRSVCYPGDERHSMRERALPAPTRLHFRNGRYEPAGGFDAFFAEPG